MGKVGGCKKGLQCDTVSPISEAAIGFKGKGDRLLFSTRPYVLPFAAGRQRGFASMLSLRRGPFPIPGREQHDRSNQCRTCKERRRGLSLEELRQGT